MQKKKVHEKNVPAESLGRFETLWLQRCVGIQHSRGCVKRRKLCCHRSGAVGCVLFGSIAHYGRSAAFVFDVLQIGVLVNSKQSGKVSQQTHGQL